MYPLLFAGVSAFSVVLFLTPLCRTLALQCGLVDRADQVRKFHAGGIPRIGGVPIYIALLVSSALLFLLLPDAENIVGSQLGIVRALFFAATIVFITGLLDDLIGLKAWQKFAGQLIASAAAVSSGVRISGVALHSLPTWWSIPVTLLWLVGCTNAFNLIDGVDGLAAGLGLFATATTLIAAFLEHNVGLAIATVPLTGALLGILQFNFNPATIFLGDSGSLLIGFLLGCYSVLWSQKSVTILGMTAPLMVLSIPLLDTGLAIVRRFLRGQPIFGADRAHIHHKLLARGLTPRRVVILLYMICGLCATLSLVQSFVHERIEKAIIVFFCVGVWVAVRHLGYAEFNTAFRMVFAGNFRRHLNAELQLSTFRKELLEALTLDQCWKLLQHSYSDFGFNEIRLKLGDRLYTHTTNGHHVANTWTVRIPLAKNGYVNLSREYDTQAPPIVARFTDAIGEVLRFKTAAMLGEEVASRDYVVRDAAMELSGGIEKPLEPAPGLQWRNSPGD